MTRNDKKEFVHRTQAQIIRTYNDIFQEEKHAYIEIDGNKNLKETASILQRKVVDMIL
jgi:thymidylate kinase